MERLSASDPAIRGRSRTERASELASKQFGAIARRQLLAIGFTSSGVERWISRGRLHPRHPGTYAWGRAELGEAGEHAAGLLFAGHGSALASLTCLWWRELLGDRPTLIHLDAPGDRRSRADLRIRHPRALQREWHRALPVTPLPAALLAASGALHPDSLRLVLARAEFTAQLSLPSLRAAIAGGRPGSRALRAAMDAHLPQLARCANGFERDFVRTIRGGFGRLSGRINPACVGRLQLGSIRSGIWPNQPQVGGRASRSATRWSGSAGPRSTTSPPGWPLGSAPTSADRPSPARPAEPAIGGPRDRRSSPGQPG